MEGAPLQGLNQRYAGTGTKTMSVGEAPSVPFAFHSASGTVSGPFAISIDYHSSAKSHGQLRRAGIEPTISALLFDRYPLCSTGELHAAYPRRSPSTPNGSGATDDGTKKALDELMLGNERLNQ